MAKTTTATRKAANGSGQKPAAGAHSTADSRKMAQMETLLNVSKKIAAIEEIGRAHV